MELSSLLTPDRVLVNLSARSKDAAIAELLDFLVTKGRLPAAGREEVLKAVMDRERSLSTGMEHGVALPHGAAAAVPELTGAMGISREGVEFATMDGRPAHLIVLLLLPFPRASRHVRTLAGIARLLRSESLRGRLLAVTTADEAMTMIRAEEVSEGSVDSEGPG